MKFLLSETIRLSNTNVNNALDHDQYFAEFPGNWKIDRLQFGWRQNKKLEAMLIDSQRFFSCRFSERNIKLIYRNFSLSTSDDRLEKIDNDERNETAMMVFLSLSISVFVSVPFVFAHLIECDECMTAWRWNIYARRGRGTESEKKRKIFSSIYTSESNVERSQYCRRWLSLLYVDIPLTNKTSVRNASIHWEKRNPCACTHSFYTFIGRTVVLNYFTIQNE